MNRNTQLSNLWCPVCNPVAEDAVGTPDVVNQERRSQGLAVAVIFPGQGTQGAAMGAPWREHPAWGVVDRAEQALGEPLAQLLLAESADELARTRESQLSVLLTSLVVWEAAKDQLPAPVAFAGHSLGQITALIASGCLPFDEGVRLAARRAEATQAAADRHPGKMAAVIGADEAQVLEACAAAPDECWLANDNAPGQIVIAGTPSGIERATKAAGDLGIRRVMPLKVGGAFHTPLMEEAASGAAARPRRHRLPRAGRSDRLQHRRPPLRRRPPAGRSVWSATSSPPSAGGGA